MKRIVIIGGGFAGVNLAHSLSNNTAFRVTLVDRNNYNFFPPLLYQVSTAFLETSSISYPFRKMYRNKKNISFHIGEFQKVNLPESKVTLSTGELNYDYLVLATGAETNYFGMENVKKHALPMKTINDALELRNHLLTKLEEAALTADETERKKLLTIVVAGAGPTGVEVSGMLAEMRKNIIPKDYPELHGQRNQSHIYLVDGGPNVLAPMSEKSQADTYKALTKMGVEIKLHHQVKDYVNDMVIFSNDETIETKNLIWAAGVTAAVFEGLPSAGYGRGKRLLVDEFNKVKDTGNVYAVGDTCFQTADKNFPNGHPQLAQVAIQQGKNLAKNFILMGKNEKLKPFSYVDKGTMAIIGRNKAVVDLPKPNLHFKGFVAWFMWLFVHLLSLINYRNRIRTLYNWMGAWLTKDQSLRMIVRPSKK